MNQTLSTRVFLRNEKLAGVHLPYAAAVDMAVDEGGVELVEVTGGGSRGRIPFPPAVATRLDGVGGRAAGVREDDEFLRVADFFRVPGRAGLAVFVPPRRAEIDPQALVVLG